MLSDAVTVQGLVVADPERAGHTDYLLDVTAAAEAGDFRPARAGEQTYQVVDLASDQVIDSGSTDANGVVVLDGEVDGAYYVVETSDTGAIPGTDSLLYPAGDPNAYIALTVVVYVASLAPEPPGPSPSDAGPASPSPAESASLVPSGSPAASASASSDGTASPISSASDAPSPSPTDSPGDGSSPSPVTSGSPVASALPSGGDAVPSEGTVASGDGVAPTGPVASRPAAPVVLPRDGIGTLPDTGSGTTHRQPMTWLALLIAAATAAGLVGAGLARRRRAA